MEPFQALKRERGLGASKRRNSNGGGLTVSSPQAGTRPGSPWMATWESGTFRTRFKPSSGYAAWEPAVYDALQHEWREFQARKRERGHLAKPTRTIRATARCFKPSSGYAVWEPWDSPSVSLPRYLVSSPQARTRPGSHGVLVMLNRLLNCFKPSSGNTAW